MRRQKKEKVKITAERSTWQLVAYRFRKNRLAMAGVLILAAMVLLTLLAPVYMSYHDMIRLDVVNKLQGPSMEHLLGTDELGRDLLGRILYGGRVSLFGGLATIILAFIGGCLIGGAAGYFGGRIDTVFMRIIDMLMAIPPIFLAMAILTALGNGLLNLILSLAVSQIPRFAVSCAYAAGGGVCAGGKMLWMQFVENNRKTYSAKRNWTDYCLCDTDSGTDHS